MLLIFQLYTDLTKNIFWLFFNFLLQLVCCGLFNNLFHGCIQIHQNKHTKKTTNYQIFIVKGQIMHDQLYASFYRAEFGQILYQGYHFFLKAVYNSKFWKMIVRNSLPQSIQYTSFKAKQSFGDNNSQHLIVLSLLNKWLDERNKVINMLYRGQHNLRFSRSSLYLAIGILDKLILRGFSLQKDSLQLVGGSLMLICTKFNEVYPVSVRKLNKLMSQNYEVCLYTEMEGSILQLLEFNLFLEDRLYQELAQLESSYSFQQLATCQQVIRTAILNPGFTFRNGSKSLTMAIQSHMNGLASSDKYSNSSCLQKEMMEIRKQLNRLHADGFTFQSTSCRA